MHTDVRRNGLVIDFVAAKSLLWLAFIVQYQRDMDAPRLGSVVAEDCVLTYRDVDGLDQQVLTAALAPSSAEAPVRITMYFGNRECAGPFVLGAVSVDVSAVSVDRLEFDDDVADGIDMADTTEDDDSASMPQYVGILPGAVMDGPSVELSVLAAGSD